MCYIDGQKNKYSMKHEDQEGRVQTQPASIHGESNLELTVPEVTDWNKNIDRVIAATTIPILIIKPVSDLWDRAVGMQQTF
jgi:hypothetical protein